MTTGACFHRHPLHGRWVGVIDSLNTQPPGVGGIRKWEAGLGPWTAQGGAPFSDFGQIGKELPFSAYFWLDFGWVAFPKKWVGGFLFFGWN